MVYWLCWEESAIPSSYYFWFNTICHCISIVQNMIVDATLMDDIELSHDNLDAVLGEPKTELIGCWTYYLSSNKTMLSLFIQSSADIAHNKNVWKCYQVIDIFKVAIIQFNAKFFSKIVRDIKC